MTTLSLDRFPPPHYRWPTVTSSLEEAVIHQLRETISIKDGSGVIATLEKAFEERYQSAFALAMNSGTAALFAAFDALDLGPGDEVLCPDYTWFATVSPLAYTGAMPVFVDCDENFNLDPHKLEENLSSRTRAVVVTHMWGMPCDILPIRSFCDRHGLRLIEDCSHAHGASYSGLPVGCLADVSVFSLQAAKLVPAGEGGILLTNNQDIYVRANLHGQYNKRCRAEIPEAHPLFKYWQTGFGLKQRIHPLGAACALHEFDRLDERLHIKRRRAQALLAVVDDIGFLQPQRESTCQSSWYMFAMEYMSERAGIPISEFQRRLHTEGLIEADVPELTGPIGDLYLFQNLDGAVSRLYPTKAKPRRHCPRSTGLRGRVMTLPIWCEPADEEIFGCYLAGLRKVAASVGGR